MLIICPKCKVKLKIPDEKVSPEGSRFRCPRCSTVLLVKKPVKRFKERDDSLVMIAHSDPTVVNKVSRMLTSEGYRVITASDGIEAMVKSLKEHPFLVIVDVALPKIYGFEVCKRIKERKETEDIKVILITSVYDRSRYKREPSSLYGADEMIEEPEIENQLLEKIRLLKEGKKEEYKKEEPSLQAPSTVSPPQQQFEQHSYTETKVESTEDADIQRARRLVRTILSDILLYNPKQVEESIRNGTFKEAFSNQLKEGYKLYQARIPQEVRDKGDFFNEEIEKFLEEKKRNMAE